MNQNLLIVDDEIEILLWLEEMFRFEYEAEIGTYTANSAYEALDLLKTVKFDVVLMDIRMPGMNGIELFKNIKENWPRCKTVFLTGYGTFEDMYQLFQHKDVRYVLKSEEDETIQKAVREAFEEVTAERVAEEERQRQKMQQEQLEHWVKKERVEQIITGDLTEATRDAYFKELEFPLTAGDKLLLLLLRIDDIYGKARDSQGKQLTFLAHLLKEHLPPKIKALIHIQDHRYKQIVMFVKSGEQRAEEDIAVVQGALEYIQEIYRNSCNETFSVVIKGNPIAAMEIPENLAGLRQVMVGFLGSNREVILQEELIAAEAADSSIPSEIIGNLPLLKSYLELHKKKEFFELLRLATETMQTKTRHDIYALEMYYSISVLLLQFINENKINEKIAFRVGIFKLTKADEHQDWETAGIYLFQVAEALFAQLGDNENSLTDRALKRIILYIEEHLSEELPLTTLAKVGGFNASYLSRLFKQNFKTTVTDYIFEKRMKLAKELLRQSDEMIQDIAAKVGYLLPHSFTRAFRSSTGVSPAEYRELNRK